MCSTVALHPPGLKNIKLISSFLASKPLLGLYKVEHIFNVKMCSEAFVDPDPYSEYGSNWAQIQCFSIHNTVTFNVIIELSSFTGTGYILMQVQRKNGMNDNSSFEACLDENIWEFEWKRLEKHSRKILAPVILLGKLCVCIIHTRIRSQSASMQVRPCITFFTYNSSWIRIECSGYATLVSFRSKSGLILSSSSFQQQLGFGLQRGNLSKS